jgi:tetratricopeptide (TPR) repeat protein
MRSFAAAETSYKTALNAYEKYQDHRGAAMIFHSLGRLALEQSHFETAEECFRKALALKLEHLPLEEHTALNHQQIGALAEKRGDFPEAERNYLKSLDLFARTDDLYSQAMIVHCCVRLTQLWPECKARVMKKISQHQNRY